MTHKGQYQSGFLFFSLSFRGLSYQYLVHLDNEGKEAVRWDLGTERRD